MEISRTESVAFTGHRTYRGEADEALHATLEQLYAQGYRNFLTGMACGFDLAAGVAVERLREVHPEVRLVAVVPYARQADRYPFVQRMRFEHLLRVADHTLLLEAEYTPGCFQRRNDFLVAHAEVVVAWFDGSTGGTHYTLRQARKQALKMVNLYPEKQQQLFDNP